MVPNLVIILHPEEDFFQEHNEISRPTLIDLTKQNYTREASEEESVMFFSISYQENTRIRIIGNSGVEEEDP
jgi:hypothetical protein